MFSATDREMTGFLSSFNDLRLIHNISQMSAEVKADMLFENTLKALDRNKDVVLGNVLVSHSNDYSRRTLEIGADNVLAYIYVLTGIIEGYEDYCKRKKEYQALTMENYIYSDIQDILENGKIRRTVYRISGIICEQIREAVELFKLDNLKEVPVIEIFERMLSRLRDIRVIECNVNDRYLDITRKMFKKIPSQVL